VFLASYPCDPPALFALTSNSINLQAKLPQYSMTQYYLQKPVESKKKPVKPIQTKTVATAEVTAPACSNILISEALEDLSGPWHIR
jgi:hypothetical protein